MAKRKPATESGPARRAPGAAPRPRTGQAGARTAGTVAKANGLADRKQPADRRQAGLFARNEGEEGAASTLPSSLDFDQRPSAARSGRAEFEERRREHPESGPGMTAGDVDADWVSAYSVGDEAPGGDNPTPDQSVVEDAGAALGVAYRAGEELRAEDEIADRDRHRWELDPASSEDYPTRTRGVKARKKEN